MVRVIGTAMLIFLGTIFVITVFVAIKTTGSAMQIASVWLFALISGLLVALCIGALIGGEEVDNDYGKKH